MADAVTQLKYVSIQHMCSSDHKPVSALFTVDCMRIDPQKELEVLCSVSLSWQLCFDAVASCRHQVFEEEMEKQDRCLNDSIPKLRLSSTAIDFGSICGDPTQVPFIYHYLLVRSAFQCL
jgi:hypothetical protein